MSTLLEKFKRDILGILWLAIAAALALALYSYTPSDPSFNTVSANSTAATATIKNLCGYFGSFFSDMAYQLIGAVSWVLVGIALRKSVRYFNGTIKKRSYAKIGWGTLLVLVLASLLELYFPNKMIVSNQIHLGGALGVLISRGLVSVFSFAGVAVILTAAGLMLIVFFTEMRLIDILRNIKFFAKMSSLAAWEKIKTFKAKAPTKAQDLAKEIKPVLETTFKFPLKEKLFGKEENLKLLEPKPVLAKPVFKPQVRQIENWELPGIDLLLESPRDLLRVDEREITRNARLVEQKLAEFDVTGQVVGVKPGPAVTMYEFKPAASIKINDITKLADDLSLALSAESLRIIAPIPGRDVVGIETSNSSRSDIYMRDLLENTEFWSDEIKLPIALGKGVTGETKIIDLRKIPHLLVAGTTGSGKSVFIMNLITSLIMRHSPKTLRLILVDPKQVDLSVFHKLPHLLLPPVKEPRPAVNTLKWLIREMEKRYRSMSQFNGKSLEAYNLAVSALDSAEQKQHEEKVKAFEANPQTAMQSYYFTPQPYVVAVIEEFADLMSVDRGGVEPAVVRLAQMARASGIHLVIAMQSPRREVLTGLIKTNFPGRISFKVASKVDSSIILDQRGAERLLSVGDMLYMAPGVSQPQRYHGAFLKDEEMNAVSEHWTKQGEPLFDAQAEKIAFSSGDSEELEPGMIGNGELEEGYDDVVAFVSSQKEVSASLLQRRFRFGYPKAARIIEILESEGVVGPANGSKPRHVLVKGYES